MWVEALTLAAQTPQGSDILGKLTGKLTGSKTPNPIYDDVGFTHAGVDQARLRGDPYYAEAARRAAAAHQAAFGTGWQRGNSPAANVARDIQHFFGVVTGEGWQPAPAPTASQMVEPFGSRLFGAADSVWGGVAAPAAAAGALVGMSGGQVVTIAALVVGAIVVLRMLGK